MAHFTLMPRRPYDFQRMLDRLSGVNHEMYRYEPCCLKRTIRVGGKVCWVSVKSTGTVDRPELEVEVRSREAAPDADAVKRHLSAMLSIDVDLGEFHKHMEGIPGMERLAKKFNGLHIIRESDLFECMTKTIVGQQLNLAFAATLNKRLIELLSPPFETEGQLYPVFPSAEQVALCSYEQLRELQFSQRKAEYTIDFAREVVSGKIDLPAMESMEDGEIMELLIKQRGIGRWTAECFLLFGLGRTDLLPAADIGLRNALRRWYGLEDQPSEAQVREMGRKWSPWSSYVTFYLWESLNLKT